MMDSIKNSFEETQSINLVRAARIISKINIKHRDEYIDNENVVTNEKLQEIATVVLQRVDKLLSQNRY